MRKILLNAQLNPIDFVAINETSTFNPLNHPIITGLGIVDEQQVYAGNYSGTCLETGGPETARICPCI
jgi:hypothetical protein